MLGKLASIFAFFALTGSSEDLKSEWKEWKQTFNKEYGSLKEETKKFVTWRENRAKILKHNNGKDISYTLAINQFADLTGQEFKYAIHGHNESCLKQFDDFAKKMDIPIVNPALYVTESDLPESVDWSLDSNVVTPIKDQGSCGSCWAFSAVGSTESRYAIANGELNSLSEQELVDCSSLNAGCNGGNMDTAFYYIKQHNGLSLDTDYVYTATDGTCESDSYTHYDAVSGFEIVEHDNMTALMAAVVDGPVSIGIQADQFAFQFYSGGILDGRCGTDIDHGVVVVGYGQDDDTGDKYWKVRNSWGTSWGEDGYVRICRDCDKNDDQGECCVLCQPSYPTIG